MRVFENRNVRKLARTKKSFDIKDIKAFLKRKQVQRKIAVANDNLKRVNNISPLECIINNISAKYFHDSTSFSPRKESFDHILAANEKADLQYLGEFSLL